MNKDILPGVSLHVPQIFSDERGYFLEAFKNSAFQHANGRDFELKQVNLSMSKAGTIRGLHYTEYDADASTGKHYSGQAKYVMCASGRIIDIIFDYKTGQWMHRELSAENRHALFIPENYAHGFIALEDSTVVYLTTSEYNPQADRTINPLAAGIDWQALAPEIDPDAYILSEKDSSAPAWIE